MSQIGRSAPHDSAGEHVRGQAVFVGEMPALKGELLVDVVGVPIARGRIRALDFQGALVVPGVVAVYTAADVPGDNHFGPIVHDEELLAEEIIHYAHQPVVAIVGESRAALTEAARRIRVDVEPLPAVLTIEQAIAAERFIGETRTIRRGDAAEGLELATHRLRGEFRIGGQEHFYLETQAALAIPGEDGEITVHSSTQNPSEIQALVANCLGLPYNKVICVCKRMGGGFGGKETQAAGPAIYAALAAFTTGRSARIVFGHEQDFRLTGKRHPYLHRYEVGFDPDGTIKALKGEFFSNGGFSADLSLAVMERTLLHSENAYFIPDFEVQGTVCRTNLPSNTAFRGFGGPQGAAAMENIIERVAGFLKLDPFEVRRRNCYGTADRNTTPYGQVVRHNTLPAILDRVAETSGYHERRRAIVEHNRRSRTTLRGISLTPVKFGISFTRRTLNQGNALVNVYLDGTVQVSTGGTEMGQGLNIKIAQVVADRLGVPLADVRVMATSTEKNNNTSPTAASASTDLNGMAALRAADAIRERLAGVAAKMLADDGIEPAPAAIDFVDGEVIDRRQPTRRTRFRYVVKKAYEDRVDLGARGFYATPGVDFNRETGRGTPFLYYTNGAAVAEVLIDRFTGDIKLERVDLLMDIGQSLNPAIDRGQIIGGFIQGMGWVTTEALVYSERGELLSDSATTYKIPNASDVPREFHLDFFENPANTENLYSSKAVGEPPLLLGLSVWTAIRAALASVVDDPELALPATNEEALRCLSQARESTPMKDSPSRDVAATTGARVHP
jgi:xanthine dehydrogenase large subunit